MKRIVSLFLAIGLPTLLLAQQPKLIPETLWKLGRVSDLRISPDGKTVIYNVRTFDIAANKGQSDLFSMPSQGGIITAIANSPEDESSGRWRPDGKKIGFLMNDKNGDSQLWEMNPDGNNKVMITNVVGGISNYGYSQALNMIWYSADVKLEKKPSEIYPDLPKTDQARIIDGLMYRHWNAWEDYAYSHVFIAEYTEGKVSPTGKDIMPNEKWDSPVGPFGGDEQIMFSPDGKTLAYTCKKLKGTEASISTNTDIYLYDITSGKTSDLTDGMKGYDNDPVWSPDGKKLLWLSMKTPGYESDRNRLFCYDLVTLEKKEVLSNYPNNVDIAKWSDDGQMIYFLSAINATHQIFSFDFNPKSQISLRQITTDQADYNELAVAGAGKTTVLVANRTDMTMPAELYAINLKSGAAKQITFTNAAVWDPIAKAKVVKRMIKTSDNKEMLAWVIYPPDFDPTKKYPTLLFCQGGPESVVSQFFSYRWNFSLMAANGYIIIAPNRRGLPSFGEEWNTEIRGDWGGQAMTDLLSAIDDISNEPYVDKNRRGAVGASFGGYSVYWLEGHHQKRFKSFIAHCGVFNLKAEYGSTEEMFFSNDEMDGPYWAKPQPKSYEAFSPINFVQDWDTPILVIHNEKDFRIPVSQGMEAFTAAQLKGIPSRFLYFPDEGHWVLKPQNSILWQRVFFDWLRKTLK